MSERKTRLVDCNPRWGSAYGERLDRYITFDCPEGHAGCWHTIPFTPALDGTSFDRASGAIWQRSGTDFGSLTLSPSIRRAPAYASREEAITAGCHPDHVEPHLLCALHIFIANGEIQFCGDSR